MIYSEWEPWYLEITDDMGYDRSLDDISVRILRMVTMGSRLIDDDELSEMIGEEVTVFGDSAGLEEDICKKKPVGTFISSGSAVHRLLRMGIVPDIVVTDLDGDVKAQIEASQEGAVTLIHAHGDNPTSILMYASMFKGPVMLTTQGNPCSSVFNFGGFTDGDRAVCLARHFDAKRILLEGFDFDNPMPKENCDPQEKLRKLGWAKRIIYELNLKDVTISIP